MWPTFFLFLTSACPCWCLEPCHASSLPKPCFGKCCLELEPLSLHWGRRSSGTQHPTWAGHSEQWNLLNLQNSPSITLGRHWSRTAMLPGRYSDGPWGNLTQLVLGCSCTSEDQPCPRAAGLQGCDPSCTWLGHNPDLGAKIRPWY